MTVFLSKRESSSRWLLEFTCSTGSSWFFSRWPLNWNCSISSPGSLSCQPTLKILDFAYMYNLMSQLLLTNLFKYTHTHTHTHTHTYIYINESYWSYFSIDPNIVTIRYFLKKTIYGQSAPGILFLKKSSIFSTCYFKISPPLVICRQDHIDI